MSDYEKKMKLLYEYGKREFSNNDNKMQAFVNTLEQVIKLTSDEYSWANRYDSVLNQNEIENMLHLDDVMHCLKRLFIGDGLSRHEGEYFLGHDILNGSIGFQEGLEDEGNQVQHFVAGLVFSEINIILSKAAIGREYWQSRKEEVDLNRNDVELYLRAEKVISNVDRSNPDNLVHEILKHIADETVTHPMFFVPKRPSTDVDIENLEPKNLGSLKITNDTANEGDQIIFEISRDPSESQNEISFHAITHRGSTSEFNSDGASPDYKGINGLYTMGIGQTLLRVEVSTDEDLIPEFKETMELWVTPIGDASGETIIGYGTIIDDDPQQTEITAENFEIDIDRFLDGGDDPRVSYVLSHNGDENLKSVMVKFYATKKGELDGNEIEIGYESAGTLRVDERDKEIENLEALRDLRGDWIVVATVEHRDSNEPTILATKEISLPEGDYINLSLDDVSLNTTKFGDGETDLVSSFTVVNNGTISTAGMKEGTGIFWSKDAIFDISEDIRIDYDSHGTLYAGERDQETETSYASNLGFDEDGFIFLMVDPDNVIAESDETDNVSDAIAVTFENESNDLNIDLWIDDISFRDDRLLTSGEDIRADFVMVNSGSDSTGAIQVATGIFWSSDDQFDFREDKLIDVDETPMLLAGERDSEYERTHYEDIPEGQGYLFYVADPLNMITEANELNNISDPYMVWIL